MSSQLNEYQKKYLAERDIRILKKTQERDKQILESKKEYADLIYSTFYRTNGGRQMKRSLNRGGMPPFYNWLQKYSKT